MTKARQREHTKIQQPEFVIDEEQRLLEIEDMRLVVKFGDKKRYSDREHEAIYDELVEAGLDDEAKRNPDAIEAVFRKLNAADEAARARSMIMGTFAASKMNERTPIRRRCSRPAEQPARRDNDEMVHHGASQRRGRDGIGACKEKRRNHANIRH